MWGCGAGVDLPRGFTLTGKPLPAFSKVQFLTGKEGIALTETKLFPLREAPLRKDHVAGSKFISANRI